MVSIESVESALPYAKSPAKLEHNQYSVILVAHIDDKPGKVVTRRLFSDINKRAVPVSNGDKVVIDEDELNALVARRLFSDYKMFKRGELIVVTEQEKMPDGDTDHFTNLLTLYTVNKKLRKLYHRPRGVPEFDQVNVDAFFAKAVEFYDFIIGNIPSLKRFFYFPHHHSGKGTS